MLFFAWNHLNVAWTLRYDYFQLKCPKFLLSDEKKSTPRTWTTYQTMDVPPNKSTDPPSHSGSNCLINFCRRDPCMEDLFHQPPHPEHLALCSPPSFHIAFSHLGKEWVFTLEIFCPGIWNRSPSVSLLELARNISFLLPCLTLLSDSFLHTLTLILQKTRIILLWGAGERSLLEPAAPSWVLSVSPDINHLWLSYRRSVRTRGFLLITGTVQGGCRIIQVFVLSLTSLKYFP